MKTNKSYLFRTCYRKRVGSFTCALAKTQRQGEEQETFIIGAGWAGRFQVCPDQRQLAGGSSRQANQKRISIWSAVGRGEKNQASCQLLIKSQPPVPGADYFSVYHLALWAGGESQFGFLDWLLQITDWLPGLVAADCESEYYFCIQFGHCLAVTFILRGRTVWQF